jgi:hypothetical protein
MHLPSNSFQRPRNTARGSTESHQGPPAMRRTAALSGSSYYPLCAPPEMMVRAFVPVSGEHQSSVKLPRLIVNTNLMGFFSFSLHGPDLVFNHYGSCSAIARSTRAKQIASYYVLRPMTWNSLICPFLISSIMNPFRLAEQSDPGASVKSVKLVILPASLLRE